MKKALILLVAMLFLTVAVGAAFAADTTFNGQYRIRAWTNWNFSKAPNHLDSEKGLYTGYFDQRFRLTITHTRSEFLKAVIQFDLVEDTWGQQRNFRINNTKAGNFVRKAYIEFKLPEIGTFTVGKQPQILGYGLVFADTSGYLDGLKWANKWGPVAVSAMYFKWDDNVTSTVAESYNRDSDIWALNLKITPNDKHAIDLFGGYVRYGTGLPLSHRTKFTTAGFTETDFSKVHANIGFAGLAYKGEIADMITLKGEFSGVFGRADLTNWAGPDDALFSGYNIYLDASYHNDLLRAGVAFVMGSGDTNESVLANHYNINFITADEFAFGNILATGGNGLGLNDSWSRGLGFANDIENLTAVKLYFQVSPTEKLTLGAAVIWAKWTESVGVGTAYTHPVNYYRNAYVAAGSSTDLGWEVDLGLKYQIMDGLTYSFAGGVLFTGDSFDYMAGGTSQDWGPIWMINNTLTYDF